MGQRFTPNFLVVARGKTGQNTSHPLRSRRHRNSKVRLHMKDSLISSTNHIVPDTPVFKKPLPKASGAELSTLNLGLESGSNSHQMFGREASVASSRTLCNSAQSREKLEQRRALVPASAGHLRSSPVRSFATVRDGTQDDDGITTASHEITADKRKRLHSISKTALLVDETWNDFAAPEQASNRKRRKTDGNEAGAAAQRKSSIEEFDSTNINVVPPRMPTLSTTGAPALTTSTSYGSIEEDLSHVQQMASEASTIGEIPPGSNIAVQPNAARAGRATASHRSSGAKDLTLADRASPQGIAGLGKAPKAITHSQLLSTFKPRTDAVQRLSSGSNSATAEEVQEEQIAYGRRNGRLREMPAKSKKALGHE